MTHNNNTTTTTNTGGGDTKNSSLSVTRQIPTKWTLERSDYFYPRALQRPDVTPAKPMNVPPARQSAAAAWALRAMLKRSNKEQKQKERAARERKQMRSKDEHQDDEEEEDSPSPAMLNPAWAEFIDNNFDRGVSSVPALHRLFTLSAAPPSKSKEQQQEQQQQQSRSSGRSSDLSFGGSGDDDEHHHHHNQQQQQEQAEDDEDAAYAQELNLAAMVQSSGDLAIAAAVSQYCRDAPGGLVVDLGPRPSWSTVMKPAGEAIVRGAIQNATVREIRGAVPKRTVDCVEKHNKAALSLTDSVEAMMQTLNTKHAAEEEIKKIEEEIRQEDRMHKKQQWLLFQKKVLLVDVEKRVRARLLVEERQDLGALDKAFRSHGRSAMRKAEQRADRWRGLVDQLLAAEESARGEIADEEGEDFNDEVRAVEFSERIATLSKMRKQHLAVEEARGAVRSEQYAGRKDIWREYVSTWREMEKGFYATHNKLAREKQSRELRRQKEASAAQEELRAAEDKRRREEIMRQRMMHTEQETRRILDNHEIQKEWDYLFQQHLEGFRAAEKIQQARVAAKKRAEQYQREMREIPRMTLRWGDAPSSTSTSVTSPTAPTSASASSSNSSSISTVASFAAMNWKGIPSYMCKLPVLNVRLPELPLLSPAQRDKKLEIMGGCIVAGVIPSRETPNPFVAARRDDFVTLLEHTADMDAFCTPKPSMVLERRHSSLSRLFAAGGRSGSVLSEASSTAFGVSGDVGADPSVDPFEQMKSFDDKAEEQQRSDDARRERMGVDPRTGRDRYPQELRRESDAAKTERIRRASQVDFYDDAELAAITGSKSKKHQQQRHESPSSSSSVAAGAAAAKSTTPADDEDDARSDTTDKPTQQQQQQQRGDKMRSSLAARRVSFGGVLSEQLPDYETVSLRSTTPERELLTPTGRVSISSASNTMMMRQSPDGGDGGIGATVAQLRTMGTSILDGDKVVASFELVPEEPLDPNAVPNSQYSTASAVGMALAMEESLVAASARASGRSKSGVVSFAAPDADTSGVSNDSLSMSMSFSAGAGRAARKKSKASVSSSGGGGADSSASSLSKEGGPLTTFPSGSRVLLRIKLESGVPLDTVRRIVAALAVGNRSLSGYEANREQESTFRVQTEVTLSFRSSVEDDPAAPGSTLQKDHDGDASAAVASTVVAEDSSSSSNKKLITLSRSNFRDIHLVYPLVCADTCRDTAPAMFIEDGPPTQLFPHAAVLVRGKGAALPSFVARLPSLTSEGSQMGGCAVSGYELTVSVDVHDPGDRLIVQDDRADMIVFSQLAGMAGKTDLYGGGNAAAIHGRSSDNSNYNNDDDENPVLIDESTPIIFDASASHVSHVPQLFSGGRDAAGAILGLNAFVLGSGISAANLGNATAPPRIGPSFVVTSEGPLSGKFAGKHGREILIDDKSVATVIGPLCGGSEIRSAIPSRSPTTIKFSEHATISHMQDIVHRLRFLHITQNPIEGVRVVSVACKSVQGEVASISRSVKVQPVDDPTEMFLNVDTSLPGGVAITSSASMASKTDDGGEAADGRRDPDDETPFASQNPDNNTSNLSAPAVYRYPADSIPHHLAKHIPKARPTFLAPKAEVVDPDSDIFEGGFLEVEIIDGLSAGDMLYLTENAAEELRFFSKAETARNTLVHGYDEYVTVSVGEVEVELLPDRVSRQESVTSTHDLFANIGGTTEQSMVVDHHAGHRDSQPFFSTTNYSSSNNNSGEHDPLASSINSDSGSVTSAGGTTKSGGTRNRRNSSKSGAVPGRRNSSGIGSKGAAAASSGTSAVGLLGADLGIVQQQKRKLSFKLLHPTEMENYRHGRGLLRVELHRISIEWLQTLVRSVAFKSVERGRRGERVVEFRLVAGDPYEEKPRKFDPFRPIMGRCSVRVADPILQCTPTFVYKERMGAMNFGTLQLHGGGGALALLTSKNGVLMPVKPDQATSAAAALSNASFSSLNNNNSNVTTARDLSNMSFSERRDFERERLATERGFGGGFIQISIVEGFTPDDRVYLRSMDETGVGATETLLHERVPPEWQELDEDDFLLEEDCTTDALAFARILCPGDSPHDRNLDVSGCYSKKKMQVVPNCPPDVLGIIEQEYEQTQQQKDVAAERNSRTASSRFASSSHLQRDQQREAPIPSLSALHTRIAMLPPAAKHNVMRYYDIFGKDKSYIALAESKTSSFRIQFRSNARRFLKSKLPPSSRGGAPQSPLEAASSRVFGGRGGKSVEVPHIALQDIAQVLKQLVFECRSVKSDLRRVLLISANDGTSNATTHIPVEINIQRFDEVTEIKRAVKKENIDFRCGTVGAALPMFADCWLEDPDTDAFNSGYVSVQLHQGAQEGDWLRCLSLEEQLTFRRQHRRRLAQCLGEHAATAITACPSAVNHRSSSSSSSNAEDEDPFFLFDEETQGDGPVYILVRDKERGNFVHPALQWSSSDDDDDDDGDEHIAPKIDIPRTESGIVIGVPPAIISIDTNDYDASPSAALRNDPHSIPGGIFPPAASPRSRYRTFSKHFIGTAKVTKNASNGSIKLTVRLLDGDNVPRMTLARTGALLRCMSFYNQSSKPLKVRSGARVFFGKVNPGGGADDGKARTTVAVYPGLLGVSEHTSAPTAASSSDDHLVAAALQQQQSATTVHKGLLVLRANKDMHYPVCCSPVGKVAVSQDLTFKQGCLVVRVTAGFDAESETLELEGVGRKGKNFVLRSGNRLHTPKGLYCGRLVLLHPDGTMSDPSSSSSSKQQQQSQKESSPQNENNNNNDDDDSDDGGDETPSEADSSKHNAEHGASAGSVATTTTTTAAAKQQQDQRPVCGYVIEFDNSSRMSGHVVQYFLKNIVFRRAAPCAVSSRRTFNVTLNEGDRNGYNSVDVSLDIDAGDRAFDLVLPSDVPVPLTCTVNRHNPRCMPFARIGAVAASKHLQGNIMVEFDLSGGSSSDAQSNFVALSRDVVETIPAGAISGSSFGASSSSPPQTDFEFKEGKLYQHVETGVLYYGGRAIGNIRAAAAAATGGGGLSSQPGSPLGGGASTSSPLNSNNNTLFAPALVCPVLSPLAESAIAAAAAAREQRLSPTLGPASSPQRGNETPPSSALLTAGGLAGGGGGGSPASPGSAAGGGASSGGGGGCYFIDLTMPTSKGYFLELHVGTPIAALQALLRSITYSRVASDTSPSSSSAQHNISKCLVRLGVVPLAASGFASTVRQAAIVEFVNGNLFSLGTGFRGSTTTFSASSLHGDESLFPSAAIHYVPNRLRCCWAVCDPSGCSEEVHRATHLGLTLVKFSGFELDYEPEIKKQLAALSKPGAAAALSSSSDAAAAGSSSEDELKKRNAKCAIYRDGVHVATVVRASEKTPGSFAATPKEVVGAASVAECWPSNSSAAEGDSASSSSLAPPRFSRVAFFEIEFVGTTGTTVHNHHHVGAKPKSAVVQRLLQCLSAVPATSTPASSLSGGQTTVVTSGGSGHNKAHFPPHRLWIEATLPASEGVPKVASGFSVDLVSQSQATQQTAATARHGGAPASAASSSVPSRPTASRPARTGRTAARR